MTVQGRVRTPGERLRTLVADQTPSNLVPPRAARRPRAGLGSMLGALWRARHIVRTVAERNLRVRYKQSFLGFAWALLTPVGLLCGLIIVFDRVAGVPTPDGVPYPLFAYVGLLAWSFFSTSTSLGGSSVLSDKALLSKARFPREIFPLSSVAVAGVDAVMASVPLVILFVLTGEVPAATTPLAVIPLLVLVVFTTGLALGMSAVIVHVRDLRLALPIMLQIGLFLTPVAYGLDLVPAWARLAYCFVNPVAPVIDSLRRTVLQGELPQWGYLGAGALTASVVLLGGYLMFKRLEGSFADVA